MNTTDSAGRIARKFNVLAKIEFRGETTLQVEKAVIADVCRFCKQALGFDLLLDITAVDHCGAEPRFEVVYHLYALERGEHLRLKAGVPEEDPEVATVSTVWQGANWHEREVFDMFGIRFSGHPDLRRILMWDGYPFYPLRKNFPLGGKPSEVPDVAFTKAAPLEGGPFVAAPGTGDSQAREPRAREMGGGPEPGFSVAG